MTTPLTSTGTSPEPPSDLASEPGDRSRLRAFIEPRMPGITFADGEDIFSLGFVNSLFAMELVLFMEKTIGTRIPNEELAMEHFRSIDAMSDLSARLRERPKVKVAS